MNSLDTTDHYYHSLQQQATTPENTTTTDEVIWNIPHCHPDDMVDDYISSYTNDRCSTTSCGPLFHLWSHILRQRRRRQSQRREQEQEHNDVLYY